MFPWWRHQGEKLRGQQLPTLQLLAFLLAVLLALPLHTLVVILLVVLVAACHFIRADHT